MKWYRQLRADLGSTGPHAFEELLSQHLDALFGMALHLCDGRQADAEDLLQDAVLRAFEGFKSLRDEAAGKSWLFTILVRTHLNLTRSGKRRRETLAADLDEADFEDALAAWKPAPTPDQVSADKELRDRITVALDTLSPDLRAVVHLVDLEGFAQREVAKMLDIPEGTVASRLFRARRVLRDELAATARELRLWRQQ
ncbi:MAG TPA: sigma-70 family RNA polymerase sigma factor [Gemmatimonadales bacterium]